MSFFQRIVLPAACQGGGPVVYDTDAQAYFNAVVSAGGAALDGTHKGAINTLVVGLKADSLWTKIDALWLFANQHATAALLDIKSLRTATAVNTPTFTADQGYAGNGTTSYVNTTYNPSSHGSQFTQNSAHMMAYTRTSATPSGARALCGATNGSTIYTAMGDNFITMNDATAVFGGPASTAGCYVGVRTSSSAVALDHNGSSVASSGASTSVGLPNLSLFVGARNNAGSPDLLTTLQMSAFSVGAALNGTERANLNTRIEAYMDALGTGVQ